MKKTQLCQLNSIIVEMKEQDIEKIRIELLQNNGHYSMTLRSKEEANKLAKKIALEAAEERKKRFNEAKRDNNKTYLYSVYDSFSLFEILKLLFEKTKNKIKQ